MALYNNKYWDSSFSHCCELLEKHDGIHISPSCLRNSLYEEFILSPRAAGRTGKQMNRLLRDLYKTAATQKDKNLIESSITRIEDAHFRRPRCAYFDEMLQMDASVHPWFGETKTQLHVATDDCTGTIVGAYLISRKRSRVIITYSIKH